MLNNSTEPSDRKNDSTIKGVPQSTHSFSESFAKIKSFFKKEISSLSDTKASYAQDTIKTQGKSFSGIHITKKILADLRAPDTKTDSTRDFLAQSSTNLKHSKNLSPKNTSSVLKPTRASQKLKKTKGVEAVPNRVGTEGNEELTANHYFAGVSIPFLKKPVSDYKNCCLEYGLEGNKNSVNCILSAFGKIWSGGSDCTVRYWNLPSDLKDVYTASSYLKGSRFANSILIAPKHKKPVSSLAKSESFIASLSIDGKLNLWNSLGKMHRMLKLDPGTKNMCCLGNSKAIAAGSKINFLDLQKFKSFRETVKFKNISFLCAHSAFTFLSGASDCVINLWDIRTPRFVNGFYGHNDVITGIAVSNGFNILSCSEDCTLREWDLRSSDNISVRKNDGKLNKVVVIGERVITAGACVKFWGGSGVENVNFHTGSVKDIAYSAEKNMLYSAGYDGLINAWSVKNNN